MLKKDDIHKYYIGSSHIASAIAQGYNDEYTHKSFEQAVNKASERLEDDHNLQVVIIVEIIAVVRRRELPIVVERL